MKSKLINNYRIVLGLFLSVCILSIFFIPFNKDVHENKDTETLQITTRVGKLMILPTDEVPMIATIVDLSKLKGQIFFKGARIGDKVLIYKRAQKVILYDPNMNKIVSFAPLEMSSSDTMNYAQSIFQN